MTRLSSIALVMDYLTERPDDWLAPHAVKVALSASTIRRALNDLWREESVTRRIPERTPGYHGPVGYEYQFRRHRPARLAAAAEASHGLVWAPELAAWLGVPAGPHLPTPHTMEHTHPERVRRRQVGPVTLIQFGQQWAAGEGVTPPHPASHGFPQYEPLE